MLSRIAESLFWIGRYVERADGTARILDVHLERLNHLPMDERKSVAQELLAVMGARPQSEDFGLPELLHALAYATRDRKQRKRQMRQLWIIRINAAARQNGLTYGQLIAGLKKAEVALDRKILADLAVQDAATFGKIAELAKSA